MNKKLVVLSAIHFPLTMARYFWEAFEMREDVKLWVTGPFSGNWIPWNNGMTIDQRYVKTPDFPLPISAVEQNIPANFIESQLPQEVDLWVDIDAGWCVSGRPKKAKVYVQIQTDPHVLKDRYRRFRPQYDKSFCMQSPYQDDGEIYLPYGYSPVYHYPEYFSEKEYDVCLIGLNYQHRASLVNRLRSMGLVVKTGIGIVYNEYRYEYNKSRVALSWSSLQDTPARFYEALAMQLPLVSNRTPDIIKNGFIDGQDYLGFDTEAEAIEKINILLNHPWSARDIAMRGYEKVTNGHSWNDRVDMIMMECGLS